MSNVITIKLSEKEAVEFYREGNRTQVVRLDGAGEGAAYGSLSQVQRNELIELLRYCEHERMEVIHIPGSAESISVCEDCGTEVV